MAESPSFFKVKNDILDDLFPSSEFLVCLVKLRYVE